MAALPNQILNHVSILSLRSFVAVVETQSFAAAARQLRIAPSTVTKHVQLIENEANAALVHRTTRRTSVTEVGERFYEHCLAILGHIDSASMMIGAEKQVIGHLKVTAPPSFAAGLLGGRLHEFMRAHPAISIDVNVTSDTPDLIRKRIDVAIAVSEQAQSKLTHFRLAGCGVTLCASPDYIARRGAPQEPDDLTQHDCLAGRFSDLAANWKFGRKGVWQSISPQFKLLADNGELLRQACLGGAGVSVFYNFHVQDDLHSGRLIHVLPEFELAPRHVFAIIPHKKIIRPQAKAFIDFVRHLLEEAKVGGHAIDHSGAKRLLRGPRDSMTETGVCCARPRSAYARLYTARRERL